MKKKCLPFLKTVAIATTISYALLSGETLYAQAPPNDECTSPIDITPALTCTPLSQNLGTSTLSTNTPLGSCVQNNIAFYPFGDMWYTFTATEDNNYTVTVNNFASTDDSANMVFYNFVVYTGTCDGLTEVYCGAGTATGLNTANPLWGSPTPYTFQNSGTPTLYYVRVVKGFSQTAFVFNPPNPPQPSRPLNIKDLSFDICVEMSEAVPLDLISFEGKQVDKKNMLFWETANEEKFDRFAIERAGDDNRYHVVGEIAGSSKAANSYKFNDENPLIGKNLYRLRMIDMDGTSKLSKVVVLNNATSSETDLSIYPNPTNNNINLNIAGKISDQARIYISDLSGKVLLEQKIISNNTEIDVENFAAGIYLIKYIDREQNKVLKLVKE